LAAERVDVTADEQEEREITEEDEQKVAKEAKTTTALGSREAFQVSALRALKAEFHGVEILDLTVGVTSCRPSGPKFVGL
jgi:hypothetical protein